MQPCSFFVFIFSFRSLPLLCNNILSADKLSYQPKESTPSHCITPLIIHTGLSWILQSHQKNSMEGHLISKDICISFQGINTELKSHLPVLWFYGKHLHLHRPIYVWIIFGYALLQHWFHTYITIIGHTHKILCPTDPSLVTLHFVSLIWAMKQLVIKDSFIHIFFRSTKKLKHTGNLFRKNLQLIAVC